ncbi:MULTISPECIES: malonate transporter subunit MadM [unclassified Psychrobacter]|uniref:malonate transporter subunit MadM n=1 Tax=unclassified Psychrobacter TaxID=196806 RepID=UPI000354E9BE|nr:MULTISPECIES: malonate transporter subunit MadM [unclassified Psychrobacter]AGP50007.1 malonate transporter [Psychrobacter sp. G]KAA0934555.1 malonate transporter subunit MadM [Psychrobacter sp. ANT_H59]
MDLIIETLTKNAFVTALAVTGLVMLFSQILSKYLTNNKLQSSAIAITLGLIAAYFAGLYTGGEKGISDIELFSGFALLGGAMLRDLAIASTAFEVDVKEIKRAGKIGIVALILGCVIPFVVGAGVAWTLGYRDAVSMTTIGAGAMTYIVGPITGTAIGASSDVIALSIAIGLIKAVFFMIATPLLARFMYLKSPRSAMIFGGLVGTTSGVAAGLAGTDVRLVPYGALVATFYTGLGALLGPSIFFLTLNAIF